MSVIKAFFLDSRFHTDSSSNVSLDEVDYIDENTIAEITDNQIGNILNSFSDRLPPFDLKSLLLANPLGKSITDYYDTYKRLDNSRRNRLVHIIVRHVYNFIVKK